MPADSSQPQQPRPEHILALKICDPAMGSGAFLVEACRQLGDALVTAWHAHDCVPALPPDEDEVLHARRLVAQRCLYGVDKNPFAVDLAKLSLWLATLAKDHPFTFLDHSLKAGDSLVGLTKRQIIRFDWQPIEEADEPAPVGKKGKSPKTLDLFADPIERAVRGVTGFRSRILSARDDVPYATLQQNLVLADEQLAKARLAGDLVIAAFFAADKDAKRKARLAKLSQQFTKYLTDQRIDDRAPLAAAIQELHSGPHPIQPFHWEIEFPEVFERDAGGHAAGGFDAIVGNPPFAGVTSLARSTHPAYTDFLRDEFPASGGKCDLVAFFFRRAFHLLRDGGTFGLIATNTVAQGDTRTSVVSHAVG